MSNIKKARRVVQAPGEREWACEFQFRGATWAAPGVFASSREEAEAKLRAIGANGVVLGEMVSRLTVPALVVGWRAALLTFLIGAVVGVYLARM